MTRVSVRPHLVSAAAFVTAATVVLNPLLPSLPDVTLPALPAVQNDTAPLPIERPAPRLDVAAPGVPRQQTPATPAPAESRPDPAYPPYALAPPAPATAAGEPDLAGAISALAVAPPPLPALPRPVSRVDDQTFWLADGDRGATVSLRRVSPVVRLLPRPAAATNGPVEPAAPGAEKPPVHRQSPGADSEPTQVSRTRRH